METSNQQKIKSYKMKNSKKDIILLVKRDKEDFYYAKE